MTVPNFAALIQALSASGVEFIIVGGVAANLQGSARTTLDLDVLTDGRMRI